MHLKSASIKKECLLLATMMAQQKKKMMKRLRTVKSNQINEPLFYVKKHAFSKFLCLLFFLCSRLGLGFVLGWYSRLKRLRRQAA